jgi:opacity protein-like surface antigen
MRKRNAVTVMLFLAAMQCAAQSPLLPPSTVRTNSIVVLGGWSWPVSHEGLTKFWGSGPALSVEVLKSVSPVVALGFDLEAAAYWFRGPEFVAAYPSLPFRNPAVAQIVAGVVGRFAIAPGKKLSPYVGGMLGFSHMTGAEYRLETDSGHVTYFNLPFQTRLALSLYGGAEYRLGRSVAVDAEARALYVNDDPNVGLTTVLRAGFRFFF